MDPRLRTFLVSLAAVGLAVFVGVELADASYAWPGLIAAFIVGAVLVRFTGLPADTIFVGLLIIGYIVGNRGFAQLMPAPGIPLLPAEIGLLLAASWRFVLCSFERSLPFHRDPLNWAVLAWLVVGTARAVFDVPRFGLMAVRDYAMIYYAAFFFLAQHMCRDPRARDYVAFCLVVAAALLLPVLVILQVAPDFLFENLVVAGVPLIYHKGDLTVTFAGVAALSVFHWARTREQRLWAWPLAGLLLVAVLGGGNRASLLGIAVAAGLLALARRWRFPLLLGGIVGAGFLALGMLATIFNHAWSQEKLHGVSDQVRSMADLAGSGRYESESSHFKGANNRFRLIWWRNVVEETWHTNPVAGLGFGADLAAGFVQEYYPENTEEFGVRSPHSIVITTFGRLGGMGLAVWLVFCLILARRTWHALRHSPEPGVWSLWSSLWVILSAAAFGVVLEGPMGAVVFWSLLGVGNAHLIAEEEMNRATAVENRAAEAEAEPPVAAPAARG